jgi:hypothetical protein
VWTVAAGAAALLTISVNFLVKYTRGLGCCVSQTTTHELAASIASFRKSKEASLPFQEETEFPCQRRLEPENDVAGLDKAGAGAGDLECPPIHHPLATKTHEGLPRPLI